MKKSVLAALLIVAIGVWGYSSCPFGRTDRSSNPSPNTSTPARTASQALPRDEPVRDPSLAAGSADEEIIRRATTMVASKLDDRLPDEPFGAWVKKTLGSGTVVTWETNDCGEQDGSSRQYSIPVCADAEAKLADGRQLSLWIVVGSIRAEDAKPDFSREPALWWAVLSSDSDSLECHFELAHLRDIVSTPSLSDEQLAEWCGGRLPAVQNSQTKK